MNSLGSAIASWWSRRRAKKTLRIVDQLPLFGGAVIHVVDLDARRLVIATSAHAICLLTQFDSGKASPEREEAPRRSGDIIM